MHPAIIGPAILHHLRQGKAVERIIVYLTHLNIHAIHVGDAMDNEAVKITRLIREAYPLEMILAEGQDMEKVIDMRLFEVPWQIDVRTDEQKQQAKRRLVSTPAPKATPPDDPKVVEAVSALFEPFVLRAVSEFRQLQQQQTRELMQQARSQRSDQSPPGGMAHE